MIAKPHAVYAASLILGTAAGARADGEAANPMSDTIRVAEVRSPANGQLVGRASLAGPAEVERAVAAAQAAFQRWSQVVPAQREAVIRAATAVARTRAGEIGRLMALEQGKPLTQCVAEVTGACDLIEYYASEAVRVEGQVLCTERAELRSYVISQPLGVVAAITPWNYPVALLSWKLGPALAAGCTVVVKPTPVTPLSPHAFCQALIDGGLPDGVVTFLSGEDALVAQPLIAHPGVAKLAFTGSTATGRQLMALAGPLFKKITLEMGGHCPAIVCADADLGLAAKAIAYKAFRNMGQSCSSINRIYADAAIHDQLLERLAMEAQALSIGDPIDQPGSDLGPMTTKAGLEKVERHVADALAHGARLVCGGGRPDGLPSAGFYYQPTVLSGMTDTMRMMREETFGPVAPIQSFTSLRAAVTAANASEYGLCAFLFTRDLGRAVHLSEALECGSVCVNHVAVNTAYGPYEGWKASGLGVELGRGAIAEYLHRKHIKMAVPACF